MVCIQKKHRTCLELHLTPNTICMQLTPTNSGLLQETLRTTMPHDVVYFTSKSSYITYITLWGLEMDVAHWYTYIYPDYNLEHLRWFLKSSRLVTVAESGVRKPQAMRVYLEQCNWGRRREWHHSTGWETKRTKVQKARGTPVFNSLLLTAETMSPATSHSCHAHSSATLRDCVP